MGKMKAIILFLIGLYLFVGPLSGYLLTHDISKSLYGYHFTGQFISGIILTLFGIGEWKARFKGRAILLFVAGVFNILLYLSLKIASSSPFLINILGNNGGGFITTLLVMFVGFIELKTPRQTPLSPVPVR